MNNILILGGDGYLGWPTAMYFSMKGHNVTIVDSYIKRKLVEAVGAKYLNIMPSMSERASLWYELTGKEIKVIEGDLSDSKLMYSLFDGSCQYNYAVNKKYTGVPNTVIHYAEQPSAPFSIKDIDSANFTLVNNLQVTNNLMFSVKDTDRQIHIIKLGTMGEYGTPDIDIEEGWIEIEHKGRKGKFLFPRQAGSIYHTSKIMDTDLLWFGVRTWGLKVTDLMQGPVYGIDTDESDLHESLRTNFCYDEIFGTILNRFIVQAVIGHPLTVYGSGGQTRGFLNIKDTLQCVYKAALNPPESSELRIFNQIMETFSANELAQLVSSTGNRLGYDVSIENIQNPRVEQEDHYYNPVYTGLKELGVEPHLLNEDVLESMYTFVEKYKNGIDRGSIFRGVKW